MYGTETRRSEGLVWSAMDFWLYGESVRIGMLELRAVGVVEPDIDPRRDCAMVVISIG
jgi:hypothetical protein